MKRPEKHLKEQKNTAKIRPKKQRQLRKALSDHRLGRNFYKGVTGDAVNILLAAATYNFKRAMRALLNLLKILSEMQARSHPRMTSRFETLFKGRLSIMPNAMPLFSNIP